MKYYIPDLLDAFPPDAKEVSAPDMDKLREDVTKRLAAERPAQKRPRRFGKTLLIAAAAAALLSVTALAAAFGGFDWLRDEVGPEFIDAVEPVEQSVTDEGIRFSVIAAQKYDDMSVYYVSLQDTSEQGRVAETTSLILGQPLGSREVKLVYYDSSNSTAVFELRVNHGNVPAEIEGDASLRNENLIILNGITYGAHALKALNAELDVYEAVKSGETAGEPYDNPTRLPSQLLSTGHVADIPGADGAYISAIGTNCGRMAVQLVFERGEQNISLTPYLVTGEGERIDALGGALGRMTGNGEIVEMYFEVDYTVLNDCTLCFEGSEWSCLRGEWAIEVDFESVSELVRTDIDTELAHNALLTLNPLGMSISAHPEDIDHSIASEEVTLHTETGNIRLVRGDWISDVGNESSAFWRSETPIDPAAVTEIRIGDTVIELD